MGVETLDEFPSSFVAGDTIKVSFSDSRFPSTEWTAKILMVSPEVSKSFPATTGTGDAFDLEISSEESNKLKPGVYVVSFVFTETSSSERQTSEDQTATTVFANPEKGPQKSIARQTLEAMEKSLLLVAGNERLTVNFNGQTFTRRNIKELQDAIDRQKSVVDAEETQLSGHRKLARILHPL